jgi:hypothetical protein
MRQMTSEVIERAYSLEDRVLAVKMMVHAADYLRSQEMGLCELLRSSALIRDGIINALDHRATGFEFRTLRHIRQAIQDPQHFPVVLKEHRRCQNCGFERPVAFERCHDHRAGRTAQ